MVDFSFSSDMPQHLKDMYKRIRDSVGGPFFHPDAYKPFFKALNEWKEKNNPKLIEPKGGTAISKTESKKTRRDLFGGVNRQRLILTSGRGVEDDAVLGRKRLLGA